MDGGNLGVVLAAGVGYIDEDGDVFIADRITGMIKLEGSRFSFLFFLF